MSFTAKDLIKPDLDKLLDELETTGLDISRITVGGASPIPGTFKPRIFTRTSFGALKYWVLDPSLGIQRGLSQQITWVNFEVNYKSPELQRYAGQQRPGKILGNYLNINLSEKEFSCFNNRKKNIPSECLFEIVNSIFDR